ncbi:MAG: hypothetical protein JWP85_1053 [Rhodoglobus sp.]|nr:hypothetical protein [Rhodoglobus sp.]
MTQSGRARTIAATVIRSPITVWAVFVLAHLWLGLLNLYAPGLPLGDVTIVYKFWVDQALESQFWVGIDSMWVYPILALVPMLAAAAFGPDQYAATWLSMVMILNAVAFGFITGWGRSRERIAVAWWWVGFLLLLGPIALGRIDSVTVPLALVGVALLATRPRAATVVLTLATWIKIWPAALLLAAVVALRERVHIVVSAIVVSAGILVVALALGGGGNVLSFITQQTGRGLQIESPVATIWLWQAIVREPLTFVYYDKQILTYQVQGAGVELASAIMTPLLALAVAVIAMLGVKAHRAGVHAGDLLPPLALALVTALIAFNKVGSPQFIAWLAVPIVLGLATSAAGHGRSFRIPAILGLVIAALTQVIYPYLYVALLNVDPLMLSVLTVRNLLLFVLLGWAVFAVVTAKPAGDNEPDEIWLPSVWPLEHRRELVEEKE